MDRMDQKIVAILRRDGALTGVELGERVGLSASAAHRRVKAMEAEGLIRGYRVRFSPQALGMPSTLFVSVTLTDQRQETLERFEAALKRCEQVVEAHLMGGEIDYNVKLAIPADDSYERVHRDVLAVLPGVERLRSQISIRAVVEQA
ncbi:Lrp/AsnC family transcriptional regulator [Sphingomonas sp. XMGL2]|uniref:Lrp/AsnC family transcriptional regulator n=2 Tax=Sphingomonas quercus TaxID=2842451 RepID=A0ABS6BLS8_9SPHN|nr:Lrp/AsnC family transcriptional regulator [Sphingomonas quercus]MBU3079265.1 Lrp/AsnC family transcriptional regulator [Sphingomonas quercus]